MAVNATVCPPDGSFKTCSCTINVQDLLLNYSDTSTLPRSDLLCLSLAVSLARLETSFGTAVVIELLTITMNPNFAAQLFSIQIKFIAWCLNIFNHTFKKHE